VGLGDCPAGRRGYGRVASVTSVSDLFPAEFDPGYGLRAELREMARQSGRMLNARFSAQIAGAENLLTKAIRALGAG